MRRVVEFADIEWQNRPFRLEYQWIDATNPEAPLIVFLHEGLGSLSMWRDFPVQLCAAVGWRGLVYSRPGYGASTSRKADEHWGPDFMHRQACEVLPALLNALKINATQDKPWLFGHSDGGSIALLYAASFPDQSAGAIVLAPHIFVEDISVNSIAAVRQTYLETDLRHKLARYHDDPDSAFWGWNDVWLSAPFRSWNIVSELQRIQCPVLAIQGLQDEYGTLDQVRRIERHTSRTSVLELAHCGHSPHKDQPEAVISAVHDFLRQQ